MKKVQIFLFSLLVLVVSSQNVFANFSDVSDNVESTQYTPYGKAILWMQTEGVVKGYNDGTFLPDNSITRAEFLKMLYGGLAVKDDVVTKPVNAFKDVEGHWAFSFIEKAYLDGLVEGYDDGTFKPENFINRAEAFKLVRVAFFPVVYDDLLPAQYTPCNREAAQGLDKIVDNKSWYFEYLEFADYFCIIPDAMLFDTDGKLNFSADLKLTRGEMAEMIYRARLVLDNSSDMFMTKYSADLKSRTLMDEGFQIQLAEELELSGQYRYGIEDEDEALADKVCFYLDNYSAKLILKNFKDKAHDWFCFSNEDYAREFFAPKGSKGRAEIKIKNYMYTDDENEGNATTVWDLAYLLGEKDEAVTDEDLDAENGFGQIEGGSSVPAYIDPGPVPEI